jgi:hypothetical protein
MRAPRFILGLVAACSSRGEQQSPPSSSLSQPQPGPAFDASAARIDTPDAALPWFMRFDFDGDGRNDYVVEDYTGGGHCCYRFTVRLTTGGEVSLPFLMDGGYVGGDLLSNPRRFAIRVGADGVAEMFMEIQTYNGEPQPLDSQWTARWGFSSHRVIIGFRGGRVTVRDQ